MTVTTLPRHVAIIPDGNRRWAKDNGKTPVGGHIEGTRVFRTIALHAAERGVEYLSIWGLSLNNFTSRSPVEVAGLLKIFLEQFTALTHDVDVHRLEIKIQVFGRWENNFPSNLKRAIRDCQAATRSYTKHYLNLFLAYNGTDEMMSAIQAIADRAREEHVKVTPAVIKEHLFTKDLPSVDVVIRTAAEPHLSAGFMMWDVAEAQLFFPDVLWPAFTTADFDAVLNEYSQRERRLGK